MSKAFIFNMILIRLEGSSGQMVWQNVAFQITAVDET
jgi:hypothetical protein